MAMAERRNIIILVIIMISYTNKTLSCNNNICLTFKITENELILTCKVAKLYLEVEFIDPNQRISGYCSLPFPTSICTSTGNHVKIWQNLSTNETFLTYTNGDRQQYGNWTCRHGSRKDKSIIEVNEDIARSGCDCWLQMMFWTFVGFITSYIATRSLVALASYMRKRLCPGLRSIEENIRRFLQTLLDQGLFCKWKNEKKPYSVCIGLICTVIIIIAFGMPLLLIEKNNKCKGVHFQIIDGMSCGVLISLMLLHFKGQNNRSSENRNPTQLNLSIDPDLADVHLNQEEISV